MFYDNIIDLLLPSVVDRTCSDHDLFGLWPIYQECPTELPTLQLIDC